MGSPRGPLSAPRLVGGPRPGRRRVRVRDNRIGLAAPSRVPLALPRQGLRRRRGGDRPRAKCGLSGPGPVTPRSPGRDRRTLQRNRQSGGDNVTTCEPLPAAPKPVLGMDGKSYPSRQQIVPSTVAATAKKSGATNVPPDEKVRPRRQEVRARLPTRARMCSGAGGSFSAANWRTASITLVPFLLMSWYPPLRHTSRHAAA